MAECRPSYVLVLFALLSCGPAPCPSAAAPPASPAPPVTGVRGSPRVSLLGLSVAKPAVSGTALSAGTHVFVEVRAATSRLVGLAPNQSSIVAFADDRGTSLLDPLAKVGPAYVEDHGARLVVSFETPRLPSRDAQRIMLRAKLVLESAAGEKRVSSTLLPGEARSLPTDAGPLHLVRADDVLPNTFAAQTGPATIIAFEDIHPIERFLGTPEFQLDGAGVRPPQSVSTQMTNGKIDVSWTYVFAKTDRPIQVQIPIVGTDADPLDVEIVAGLGVE